MADALKFDCPKCSREYELALSLEEAINKKKRAQCSRCGEQFEIAARALNGSPSDVTPNENTASANDPIEEDNAADCEILSEEPCDTSIRTHVHATHRSVSLESEEHLERTEPKALNWLEQATLSLDEYTLTTPGDINPLQSLFSKWG